MRHTPARGRFATKRFARQPAVVVVVVSLIAHAAPVRAQQVTAADIRPVERSVRDTQGTEQIRSTFLRDIALDAGHFAQGSPPVAPSDATGRNWASRHPTLLGTLIGAGGMGTYAAALRWKDARRCGSIGLENRSCLGDGTWAIGVPVLLGAGAGAFGGLIVSARQNAKLRYEASANPPDVAVVKRVLSRIGEGRRIIVSGVGTEASAGQIQAIGPDGFTMVRDGQAAPVQIAYGDVRAVRAAPGPGTKVGIAAGIIAGISLSVMCAKYCGGN